MSKIMSHTRRAAIPKVAPKAEYFDDVPWTPDLRVFEEEQPPIDTGLLDANGTKVYRHHVRNPIGFRKDR